MKKIVKDQRVRIAASIGLSIIFMLLFVAYYSKAGVPSNCCLVCGEPHCYCDADYCTKGCTNYDSCCGVGWLLCPGTGKWCCICAE